MKKSFFPVAVFAAAMAATATSQAAQFDQQTKQSFTITNPYQHSQSPMLGFRSGNKKPGI